MGERRLAIAHLHGTNDLKSSLLTSSEHAFMASSQKPAGLRPFWFSIRLFLGCGFYLSYFVVALRLDLGKTLRA